MRCRSPQATAAPSDSEIREYDKSTYDTWTRIVEANRSEATRSGMAFKECRNYWGKEGPETEGLDGTGLWWKDVVKGFELLNLQKDIGTPEGAVMGVKYQTICLNVPHYLRYLMDKIRETGVNVVRSEVDVSGGLERVVKDAKRIAMESNKSLIEGDILALINCTGLGARHFVGDEEAAKLFPIRGQTITVKGEATMDRTYDEFPSSSSIKDELTYVIPRPGSGTTIFGGCKQAGNWDAKVDHDLNGRIMERIKKWGLAEELRKEGSGDFEVVSSQVGLRPGRVGGPRVETEGEKTVGGVWVVHSYGHAGAGYQNSAACSEKVAKIVEKLGEL